MAIARRTCLNHPDRTAIGVCVMTRKPICAECSTRYEGVNYSHEGLAMLHESRAKEMSGGGGGLGLLAFVAMPLLLVGLYLSYLLSVRILIDMLRGV